MGVPDRPYLGFAAVADLVRLFDGKLMCGHRHRLRHFNRLETNLVTTSLSTFLENLRSNLHVQHIFVMLHEMISLLLLLVNINDENKKVNPLMLYLSFVEEKENIQYQQKLQIC